MPTDNPPDGPLTIDSTIRVRYAETDQMGVVYHANYLVWFEVGRVELLRSLGFTYRDLEQQGYFLPVIEVRCRFERPARYDDLVSIRTVLTGVSRLRISFQYLAIRAESGETLAEAETHHVFVDRDGLPRRLAPDMPLWRRLRERQPLNQQSPA